MTKVRKPTKFGEILVMEIDDDEDLEYCLCGGRMLEGYCRGNAGISLYEEGEYAWI